MSWARPGRAQQPTPDEIEAARARYAEGMQQFQYDDAIMDRAPTETQPTGDLATWERFQATDPRARPFVVKSLPITQWKIFYNLGQICLQLGDEASAMVALSRYLDAGGANVPAQRGREVERQMAELRPKLGTLVIAVSPSDAAVFVAGERLHGVPADPTWVEPGSYAIEARRTGMRPVAVSVSVKAGDDVRVPIALQEGPPTTAAPGATAVSPATPPIVPRRGCACAMPGDRSGTDGDSIGLPLLALLAAARPRFSKTLPNRDARRRAPRRRGWRSPR